LFNGALSPTYTFGIMTAGSDYMHTILGLLYSREAKSIAVLRCTAGFTQSVWTGMLALLPTYPTLTIVANISYPPGTATQGKFNPLIQQLQLLAPKVDVFIALSFLADGPFIISAVRSFNWQPKAIAMTSAPSDGNSLYVLGPDQWSPFLPDTISDPFFGTPAKYNVDYLTQFPNPNQTAASGYSAGASASGYVFATAISRAASLSQVDVRDALATIGTTTTSFQTFYGNVTFNVKGQNFAKEMVVDQNQINKYNEQEPLLVGPEPYNQYTFVFPTLYGCNDTKACNFQNQAVFNNSCYYAAKCTSSCSLVLPTYFVIVMLFAFYFSL